MCITFTSRILCGLRMSRNQQAGNQQLKTELKGFWTWSETNSCSPALMGVLVLRSLARTGLLEVLESLLADTRYITPPMQRKPLFLQHCWTSWDLPPWSESRVWFNNGDLQEKQSQVQPKFGEMTQGGAASWANHEIGDSWNGLGLNRPSKSSHSNPIAKGRDSSHQNGGEVWKKQGCSCCWQRKSSDSSWLTPKKWPSGTLTQLLPPLLAPLAPAETRKCGCNPMRESARCELHWA